MEGFITKQGQFVKNWKVRWFCLENDVISYYKDQTKFILKKKCVLLPNSTVESSPDMDVHKNIITINLGRDAFGLGETLGLGMALMRSKVMILSADSAESKILWIKAFQSAINKLKNEIAADENYNNSNKITPVPVTTNYFAAPAPTPSPPPQQQQPQTTTQTRQSEDAYRPSEDRSSLHYDQDNSGSEDETAPGGQNVYSKPKRKTNTTRRRMKRGTINEQDTTAQHIDSNVFRTSAPAPGAAMHDVDLPRVSEIGRDGAFSPVAGGAARTTHKRPSHGQNQEQPLTQTQGQGQRQSEGEKSAHKQQHQQQQQQNQAASPMTPQPPSYTTAQKSAISSSTKTNGSTSKNSSGNKNNSVNFANTESRSSSSFSHSKSNGSARKQQPAAAVSIVESSSDDEEEPPMPQPQASNSRPPLSRRQSRKFNLYDNWVEVQTDDGQTYYYHKISRVTRWDKPEPHVAEALETRLKESQQATERAMRDRKAHLEREEEVRLENERVIDEAKIANDKALNKWRRHNKRHGDDLSFPELLRDLSVILPNEMLVAIYDSPNKVIFDSLSELNSGTEPALVKKTYLKIVRFIHPDKLPATLKIESKMLSEQIFILLTEKYDMYRKSHGL